jgi:hypothetical protein
MALAAAATSLGACSPVTGTSAPGDGGPTPNQGEASSTNPGSESVGDGGEASESTPLDGGDAASAIGGAVTFFAGGGSGAASTYQVIAAFDQVSGKSTAASPCGPTVNGCSYCDPTADGGASGNLEVNFVSAGTITIDDGAMILATLADDGDAEIAYETDSNLNPAIAWKPGDSLSVSASGGVQPAFSGSITAPADLAGVTPALSLESPVTVSVSTPFVVSWAPSADNGSMKLVLGTESLGNRATIGCTVPESTGQISVPASLLAMLAGGALGSGTVGLTKTVSSTVNGTGPDVVLLASPPRAQGQVTFSN